jgi:phosphate butyryltransferase
MKGRYLSHLSSNDPLYDYIQGHIAPQLGVHLFAVINDAISQGNPNRLYRKLADLKSYPKLLYITDAAINITPDLATKMHIVQNAVDIARLLGVTEPKVAALSAVEVINPAISSTIDAACLAKMAERGQITGAVVDGPLAFDNAFSAESAKVKGISSPVSGDVDILMVPDLVSGNILGEEK